MSRVDASVSTFAAVQDGLVAGSIGFAGSPEQRAEWMIDGEKRWIRNATHADMVVVRARDIADGEVKGFIVPADAAGFAVTRIERKIALPMVQNGHIVLDGVRVPDRPRLPGASSFRETARAGADARRGGVEHHRRHGGHLRGRTAVHEGAHAVRQARRGAPARAGPAREVARAHHRIDRPVRAGVADARRGPAGRRSLRAREGVHDGADARGRRVAPGGVRGNGIVTDYDVARFFVDAEALYTYEGTAQMNSLIVGKAITGTSAFA